MDWINRYIDNPLLEGAAWALRLCHTSTGRSPERLEPVWNIVVLSNLFIVSGHFLAGPPLLLGLAALAMLAIPSAYRMITASLRGQQIYGAREYKAMRARAISNREAQWALRVIVIFCAACLPFFAQSVDPTGKAFLLGASLWFVLTAPVKFYIDAAEPPVPNDGDRGVRGNLQLT